ncbi:MAG: hypothetical protein ABI388_11770 [Bacteroidia bacterium]
MKHFFSFLFVFSIQLVLAQDTIYFNKGNNEIVSINEINTKEIKYHTFNNLSGSLTVISTNDVSKIVYKTGLVQFFTPPKNPDDDKNRWLDDTYREVPIQKLPKNIWASKFGYYFSTGIGAGGCNKKSGFAQLASFSFAYKSHMISVSGGHFNSSFIGEPARGYAYCEASYYGVSLGESLRFKWLLLSASAGIGSSTVSVYTVPLYHSSSSTTDFNAYRVLSMPIEFKLFFTSPKNGIGVGFHLVEDMLSLKQYATLSHYSSLYFGVCIVTGFWNKTK